MHFIMSNPSQIRADWALRNMRIITKYLVLAPPSYQVLCRIQLWCSADFVPRKRKRKTNSLMAYDWSTIAAYGCHEQHRSPKQTFFAFLIGLYHPSRHKKTFGICLFSISFFVNKNILVRATSNHDIAGFFVQGYH